MYSFAQRDDTIVVDEPLYGHYLLKSGARHPGAAEVMRVMDCDAARVINRDILGYYDKPLVFFKNMCHHLIDLDWSFLDQLVNVLLIRDPAEMLSSLINQIPEPDMLDTGMALQEQLFDHLDSDDRTPPVLDSKLLLQNPSGVLKKLCARINVGFDEKMLHWKPGARPEDGIWARYWYHKLHLSSGFSEYRPRDVSLPGRILPLYEKCRVIYDKLYKHAIN
jgi:hypothetical protein